MEMEEKTLPMWRLKLKIKLKKAGDAVKAAGREAWAFCRENPEAAVGIGGSLAVGARALSRKHKIDSEIRRRECDKYDPRTGEHVFTYKPLTSKQKRLVDEMRRVDPQETYVSAYTKLGIKFR